MAGATIRHLTSPAFATGVAVGAACATLYVRLFCQQMPDRLAGEDEDNDSARKTFWTKFNISIIDWLLSIHCQVCL